LVYEPLFAESLAALIPLAQESDDYVMAAQRVLSRDPEIGKPIARGSPVYFIPMAPIGERAVSLITRSPRRPCISCLSRLSIERGGEI
jgi:hypothetical protein